MDKLEKKLLQIKRNIENKTMKKEHRLNNLEIMLGQAKHMITQRKR